MKIIMLPDYSENNPYQKELASALRRRGLEVYFANFGFLPILRSIWNLGKPDILHLHWTDGYMLSNSWVKTLLKTARFLLELVLIKILGVKVVWTVHNLSNHEKVKQGYERIAHKFFINLYDKLIVHCSPAREAVINYYALSEVYADRINIVPHGNYINCYENIINRNVARKKLNYEKDDVVFLFLGSIRPYKGVQYLIENFHDLENNKVRLLIAGNPANADIKNEILRCSQPDSRIALYLQFIPDSDIQLYLNAADVAVFPYKDILTSGSVLLAMSFSKAVIAPRSGCVFEVLDLQEDGLLYDPGDPSGLLQAMRNAIEKDLTMIGELNHACAEEFSWDGIAEKTQNVYLSA